MSHAYQADYEREHARLSEVLGILSEFFPAGQDIRTALTILAGEHLIYKQFIVRLANHLATSHYITIRMDGRNLQGDWIKSDARQALADAVALRAEVLAKEPR